MTGGLKPAKMIKPPVLRQAQGIENRPFNHYIQTRISSFYQNKGIQKATLAFKIICISIFTYPQII